MNDYIPCGFKSFCSRPERHRGHHGGWRTGVQIIVPDHIRGRNYNGSPYTPGDIIPARALAVVAEYVAHGGFKEAANCLGISLQTVKNHASTAIATTGAASTSNAAFRLGWVHFPVGLGHPQDFRNWEGDGI